MADVGDIEPWLDIGTLRVRPYIDEKTNKTSTVVESRNTTGLTRVGSGAAPAGADHFQKWRAECSLHLGQEAIAANLVAIR